MTTPIQRVVGRGTTPRSLLRSMQAISANVAEGGNLVGGGTAGGTFSETRVYNPTPTAANSITWTILDWQSVSQDSAGWFDVGDPSRITVDADGVYMVSFKISWVTAPTATDMAASLLVNGSSLFRPMWTGKLSTLQITSLLGSIPVELSSGDYLELEIFHRDPNPLDLSGTSGEWDNWFDVYHIGSH